jgi:hypothetical protein
MYKIIHNNIIVDVVKELRYVKYIPEFKKIIPTSRATAQAICGSKNKIYYALQGVEIPAEKSHWKVVTFIKIGEKEYNCLKEELCKNYTIYANKKELNLVRTNKISEMSSICKQKIIDGVSVLMDDGHYYKFRLTVEDQLNLLEIERDIINGQENILYHSTDNVCRFYTKDEMMRLILVSQQHKNFHTTYFNLLKYCINNMDNVSAIDSIEYGVDLLSMSIPDKVKSIIRERLNGK